MCEFILIKGNINNPSDGLLTSFILELKCLECARNPRIYSLRAGPSEKKSFPLVCVKWRLFPKQELILSQIVLVT